MLYCARVEHSNLCWDQVSQNSAFNQVGEGVVPSGGCHSVSM